MSSLEITISSECSRPAWEKWYVYPTFRSKGCSFLTSGKGTNSAVKKGELGGPEIVSVEALNPASHSIRQKLSNVPQSSDLHGKSTPFVFAFPWLEGLRV